MLLLLSGACGLFLRCDFFFPELIAMPLRISFLCETHVCCSTIFRGSTLNASGKFCVKLDPADEQGIVSCRSVAAYIFTFFFFSSTLLPFPKPNSQVVKVSLTWSYRYFDAWVYSLLLRNLGSGIVSE